MSNRLFQTIVHQMKDVVGRTIGVIDENGIIIASSELTRIGESRQRIKEELPYSLENLVHEINAGKTPEIIDRYVPVKRGAFAIGMQVRDIFWPTGLFVLSHKQVLPEEQRSKHAPKALHEGDIIHVRCTTFDAARTEEKLKDIVGDWDASDEPEK